MANERWISILDIYVARRHEIGPQFNILDIFERLQQILINTPNDLIKLYQKGTIGIRLASIEIEKEYCKLLFQLSDENASDPVFGNLKSWKLRDEAKQDGEGLAVSAHMIISLKPSEEAGHTHIAAFELVPGFGQSFMGRFLKHLFYIAYLNETFTDHDDEKKKKRVWPIPELDSHPSQTLKDIVENRQLTNISFITREVTQGMDQQAYTSTIEKYAKLKINTISNDPYEWIKNLRSNGLSQGFEDMRVSFKSPSSKVSKSESILLQKNQDAATALFSQQHRVELDKDMKQCERDFLKCMEIKLLPLIGLEYQVSSEVVDVLECEEEC